MRGSVVSRRTALWGAAAVLGSGAESRLRVVVVGGHPGDPEYGCGGTIARYTGAGHVVTVAYLNRGERGCAGQSEAPCGELRTAEAGRACAILKARAAFVGQKDGEAVVDDPHYRQFDELIAAERPDVVFTHWPMDRHRDHRAAAALAQDAWVRAEGRFALMYYEVAEDTVGFRPDDYVDITGVESARRAACYAHASQRPDHYYPAQTAITRWRGEQSGHAQAEAFARHARAVGARLLP